MYRGIYLVRNRRYEICFSLKDFGGEGGRDELRKTARERSYLAARDNSFFKRSGVILPTGAIYSTTMGYRGIYLAKNLVSSRDLHNGIVKKFLWTRKEDGVDGKVSRNFERTFQDWKNFFLTILTDWGY